MMSVTCTFLSPLIHQLLACKMSKNDVVKISQHGHHNVSMCGSLVAEFAMSTWLLWSSVLHYINLVVWCLYAQPTIFILDQFNNNSRADTDCLMKIHSLQNPPNHPWMMNLKSYVKEIPAFFSYRRKNIYCIISSFLISCIPTWLISWSKWNWLATTLMIDLFFMLFDYEDLLL